jgi:uncharacterized protein YjiS (DUF1127 family)
MALTHLSFPGTLGTSLGPRDHALALLRLALKPFRRALLRQELEALPDRLLADIGLERADLPRIIRGSR